MKKILQNKKILIALAVVVAVAAIGARSFTGTPGRVISERRLQSPVPRIPRIRTFTTSTTRRSPSRVMRMPQG